MPDEPATPDLSLMTTDALIEELAGRHDALLVVREAFRLEGRGDWWCDYRGGVSACIGLAERAKQRLLGCAAATATDDNPGPQED